MIIKITDRHGKRHELQGIEGWRVMEIIRDYGLTDPDLALKAECGGAMACATCHIYVSPAWREKLVPPTEEETDMLLDSAFEVTDDSRLSCQILMREDLDGLEVTLAPGTEP